MLEVLIVGLVVIGYAAISGRVEGTPVTAPIVFTAAGVGLGAIGLLDLELGDPFVHTVFEATLVIVLFTDATRIDFGRLRDRLQVPVRLLTVGMALSIVLGTAAGLLLLDLPFWPTVVLAVVLTPTDAALGQAVVTSDRVPRFVRQTLNVESGLNDGLALPVLTIALAFAGASADAQGPGYWAGFAGREIGVALVLGGVVGWLGGRLIAWGRGSGWMNLVFAKLAGLSLALVAFAATDALGGSGFIAAFVAGAVLGNTARSQCAPVYEFAEVEGQLFELATFLLFGAIAVAPAFQAITWQVLAYAVVSLTVVRMVAVATALAGTHLRAETVAFVGWFGPRGLASILFGLLVLEGAEMGPTESAVFSVVAVTVTLSVALHGATAAPLARRYGDRIAAVEEAEAMAEMAEMPELPTGFRTG